MSTPGEVLEALRRKALDPASTEDERRSSALEALRWAEKHGFSFVAGKTGSSNELAELLGIAATMGGVINSLIPQDKKKKKKKGRGKHP